MRTADFAYDLPVDLIAQAPLPERDQSRLLVLDRATRQITHGYFSQLVEYLQAGDVLVLNDSRVIPARLRGVKPVTGGQFEILLLEENQVNDWWVMLRPGKRVRAGTRLQFLTRAGPPGSLAATVQGKNPEGHCRLLFEGTVNVVNELMVYGETPLPPYIRRPAEAEGCCDPERYQTVFARAPGSVAAPTAGLHFTAAVLETLRQTGVRVCFVTLHVGPATFAPVKCARIEHHPMHAEHFRIHLETERAIEEARRQGGRVVAVGTTTVRVLESVAAQHQGRVVAAQGDTRLFIYPPYRFQVVDRLLTNFHLPESTLLMLVCAFAAPGGTTGREWMLQGYAEAVRRRYRFFSFGDVMIIL